MGELIDLHSERAKRQAEKDRQASKLYHPRKEAPMIDPEWDDAAGRFVETIHVPPYHRDRDCGDET